MRTALSTKGSSGKFFEQRWLSLEYKAYSFTLGETAVSNLLSSLGKKKSCIELFEKILIAECSGEVTVDGQVIPLAEPGYTQGLIKTDRLNLLEAYDVKLEKLLCSRMFRGSPVDKKSVKDFVEDHDFRDTLFKWAGDSSTGVTLGCSPRTEIISSFPCRRTRMTSSGRLPIWSLGTFFSTLTGRTPQWSSIGSPHSPMAIDSSSTRT